MDDIEFGKLVEGWKKSNCRVSPKAMTMAQDSNYLRIIGNGMNVVPYILRQMQKELVANEPDHWFVALWLITGENPVQPQHRGILREMARDWINWGLLKGFITETPRSDLKSARDMDEQEAGRDD